MQTTIKTLAVISGVAFGLATGNMLELINHEARLRKLEQLQSTQTILLEREENYIKAQMVGTVVSYTNYFGVGVSFTNNYIWRKAN